MKTANNKFSKQAEDFSRQAEEFVNAAREARVPESVQAFAEDSIARSRDAYVKLSGVSRDASKAIGDVVEAAQANAKTLSERVLANALSNTDAAFDAASAMARSKSLPEAFKVQSDFFQTQMAKVGEQNREFFEMSAALGRKTLEAMNSAARGTFTQMKS